MDMEDTKLLLACDGKNLAPIKFSLPAFLSRYLAGGESLRGCRKVSRMRLAMVISGLDIQDFEALSLYRHIERYNQAKELLLYSKNIDCKLLCKVNHLVTFGKKGKLRKTQNYIGRSIDRAIYLPPPAADIQRHMDTWCSWLNSQKQTSVDIIIEAYVKLILIHPFDDGNGRTARLVFDALRSRAQSSHIHPSIYRLGINPRKYLTALRAFGIQSNEGAQHPFWAEAQEWGNNYQKKAKLVIKDTQSRIQKKLGIHHLSCEEATLLDNIWTTPILSFQGLFKQFDWRSEQVISAVEKLTLTGVLTHQKSKIAKEQSIFVADDIFNCWQKLDDMVFEV